MGSEPYSGGDRKLGQMMTVDRLTPSEWKEIAALAHSAVFSKNLDPRNAELLSHALLLKEGDQIVAYLTAQQFDLESIYWKHGGALPPAKGRYSVRKGYLQLIESERQTGFKRIITYIENKNTPMMRLSADAGFLVTGVKTFEGHVLVEKTLELR